MRKIVISGGSGLVGQAMIDQFPPNVEEIVVLTRNASLERKTEGRASYSHWNPSKGFYSKLAFEQADAIVNLAGASVSKRWTSEHKERILRSRLDSTNLLVQISRESQSIRTFVSASAIGYYEPSSEIHSETSGSSTEFLGHVVGQWEEALRPLANTEIRTVMLRIGLVLARKGGFYEKMSPVFKKGLGSTLGNGKQWMSWIHIDDLVAMFWYALSHDSVSGVYNAVSPEVMSNREFTRKMAASFAKKVWLPAVPGFALKLLLGEMASVALDSIGVSCQRIQDAGFEYQFPELSTALAELSGK